MKLLFFSLIFLTTSSVFAAVCGELDNESFDFERDGGLRAFAVDVPTSEKKLYITKSNSSKLFDDVVLRFKRRNYNDRFEMGLFTCLDKYTVTSRKYKSGLRYYSKTEEHRLWENGALVAKYPTVENLIELADKMGEYFSTDDLIDFDYTFEVLTEESSLAQKTRILQKARNLSEKRNQYLKPQGEVYEYTVLAVFKEGKLRGYIIAIEDNIDHSLWDGSGVTYYLDIRLDQNARVEWTG